jgi:hypothetical protein
MTMTPTTLDRQASVTYSSYKEAGDLSCCRRSWHAHSPSHPAGPRPLAWVGVGDRIRWLDHVTGYYYYYNYYYYALCRIGNLNHAPVSVSIHLAITVQCIHNIYIPSHLVQGCGIGPFASQIWAAHGALAGLNAIPITPLRPTLRVCRQQATRIIVH